MSLDSTKLKDEIYTAAKPIKFNFLNRLDLSSEVIRKLSLNLNRIVTGSSDVFLTPIAKDNDPDSLLSDLDSIFERNKHLISDNLLNLEQSNRSKFGPRSISKPWLDRKDSLYQYFKSDTGAPLPKFAFNFNTNMRPLSVQNASSFLKRNTNSGLPFYTNKGSILNELVSDFPRLLSRQDPCVLFTRTQEGGKTRNVWGFPSADTLNEMRFYQPLLNYQSKLSWRRALLGPDEVDKSITSMMKSSNNSSYSYLSIDFSSYDATIGKSLQSASFDYISKLFQSSSKGDVEYIADRFNTIGIITPDGVIDGKHGVPSGSTFTNEVDSLAQYLIVKSANIDCDYQIQGDDGAYLIRDRDISTLKSKFVEHGLVVNDTKSYTSKDFIVYLQKLYDIRYLKNGLIGGIYPLYRALDRLLYQERYSDFMDYSLKGSDYYSIRAISILENCKYHPLFKEFVGYILTKDKFKLRFSMGAISKYDRMLKNGAGTIGFINNQYGDNIKGIMSFKTVKIINEMS